MGFVPSGADIIRRGRSCVEKTPENQTGSWDMDLEIQGETAPEIRPPAVGVAEGAVCGARPFAALRSHRSRQTEPPSRGRGWLPANLFGLDSTALGGMESPGDTE